MSKTKRANPGRLERLVSLLATAATAQDDLAKTYRDMEWDIAADNAESEAREYRRRIESFTAQMKQAND